MLATCSSSETEGEAEERPTLRTVLENLLGKNSNARLGAEGTERQIGMVSIQESLLESYSTEWAGDTTTKTFSSKEEEESIM